jgi:hypothetical protein
MSIGYISVVIEVLCYGTIKPLSYYTTGNAVVTSMIYSMHTQILQQQQQLQQQLQTVLREVVAAAVVVEAVAVEAAVAVLCLVFVKLLKVR